MDDYLVGEIKPTVNKFFNSIAGKYEVIHSGYQFAIRKLEHSLFNKNAINKIITSSKKTEH